MLLIKKIAKEIEGPDTDDYLLSKKRVKNICSTASKRVLKEILLLVIVGN
jgi:hypothetical protein